MALKKSIMIECTHHWIIDVANGPISSGICIKCTESREFYNSISDRQSFTHLDVPRTVIDQNGEEIKILGKRKRGPSIVLSKDEN